MKVYIVAVTYDISPDHYLVFATQALAESFVAGRVNEDWTRSGDATWNYGDQSYEIIAEEVRDHV